jgi:phage gp36-like protein
MDYASAADMSLRFSEQELIELTDRASVPPVTLNAAVLAAALGDAQAFADGYLGRRFVLPLLGCIGMPLTPEPRLVPRQLMRITCDVARFYLYDDAAPDEVRQAFQRARNELEAIAKGETLLSCPYGGAPGVELISGSGADVPASGFAERQITDAGLAGFLGQ